MNKSNALLYYKSANAYYLGATTLMEKGSASAPGLSMAQPSVTCARLALKLYFKCLLAHEDNDSDESMLLAALFRRLKAETQKTLLARFDEFSNTELSSSEFMKHIEALDNACAKWRFIHEQEAKNVNLEDMGDMILAAKSVITAANPELCQ